MATPDPDSTESLRVDVDRLGDASHVEVVDEAVIVVTQAFCHRGHPLVAEDNPRFSGYPGVRLRVKVAGESQEIVLSPIHGHHERTGGEGMVDGTKCSVRCPTCDEELIAYAPCPCGNGTLRGIFLTEDLAKAHVAAVCDVWGCQRSRVIDEWEILSEFVMNESQGDA